MPHSWPYLCLPIVFPQVVQFLFRTSSVGTIIPCFPCPCISLCAMPFCFVLFVLGWFSFGVCWLVGTYHPSHSFYLVVAQLPSRWFPFNLFPQSPFPGCVPTLPFPHHALALLVCLPLPPWRCYPHPSLPACCATQCLPCPACHCVTIAPHIVCLACPAPCQAF